MATLRGKGIYEPRLYMRRVGYWTIGRDGMRLSDLFSLRTDQKRFLIMITCFRSYC